MVEPPVFVEPFTPTTQKEKSTISVRKQRLREQAAALTRDIQQTLEADQRLLYQLQHGNTDLWAALRESQRPGAPRCDTIAVSLPRDSRRKIKPKRSLSVEHRQAKENEENGSKSPVREAAPQVVGDVAVPRKSTIKAKNADILGGSQKKKELRSNLKAQRDSIRAILKSLQEATVSSSLKLLVDDIDESSEMSI